MGQLRRKPKTRATSYKEESFPFLFYNALFSFLIRWHGSGNRCHILLLTERNKERNPWGINVVRGKSRNVTTREEALQFCTCLCEGLILTPEYVWGRLKPTEQRFCQQAQKVKQKLQTEIDQVDCLLKQKHQDSP